MSELTPDAEQALAAMSEAEVTDLLSRVRDPRELADPMERAAEALRQSHRRIPGRDGRDKATKAQAAAAMRMQRRGRR